MLKYLKTEEVIFGTKSVSCDVTVLFKHNTIDFKIQYFIMIQLHLVVIQATQLWSIGQIMF